MQTAYIKGERPNAEWTTRQLRKYIRDVTKVVNAEYTEWENEYGEYTSNKSWDPLRNMVGRLQELAGTKPKKVQVGLGLSYKHKTELVEQAQALWNYQERDIYTPGGMRRDKKRQIARYMEYIGFEPPKDINEINIEEFHEWEGRYESQVAYENYGDEYLYDESQKDWYESYEEREARQRREAGEAAYDLAKEEDRKKFDSFLKNHDIDITFDEWEAMVNYSGGVGNFIAQELSSETIVEQVKQRTREGRITLDLIYNEAQAQVEADVASGKTKAVTPQRIVDKMAEISKNWGQLKKV